MFTDVSAAVGAGPGGSVSAGSLGFSMDGTAAVTSAAEPSVTAAQGQPKPVTAGGVVTVASGATAGVEKHGPTDAQTLNGSAAATNCHIPGGGAPDSSQPAVTVANGPVSASKGGAAVFSATPTIIRTTLNPQNVVTSPVISSQLSVKTVPTVTLVRAPMQTSTIHFQSADNAATSLTSPPSASVTGSTTGSPVNKADSTKTLEQSGTQVVASTVATATMRSSNVLQNLRASVPSTISTASPGGIRAIAPQVLAARLTQPQQNATNIQNIQLPPGNTALKFKGVWEFSVDVKLFLFTLRQRAMSCRKWFLSNTNADLFSTCSCSYR